jgi:sterol desaturase/sphingolipid hydroxylase (fatty acid hydroxylase superfamily)
MKNAFSVVPLNKEVPKEQEGNLLLGLIFHLGPSITFIALLVFFGMSLAKVIGLYMAISVVFIIPTLIFERYNPAVAIEMPNFKEFMNGLSVVFYKGILVGGGFIAAGWWICTKVFAISTTNNGWATIIFAVFLTDLFYYMIHRFMSHGNGNNPIIKFYRKAHGAHHNVSELDFIRGNQSSLIDTALSQFQPSIIFISAVLGMDLSSTFIVYGLVLMLQSTDHVNFTCNIGILKYLFMDNHAHRFHHCKRGNLVNHGAVFSIYDRIFGTYYEDWDISSGYIHHNDLLLPIKREYYGLFPSKEQNNTNNE